MTDIIVECRVGALGLYVVVELLLLICTWEFNTEQKLTRKYKLLLLLV